MGRASSGSTGDAPPGRGSAHAAGTSVADARPSEAQRRYLARGLTQAGGKLPLFDREGGEVPQETIAACMAQGWAEPWTENPIRPDWLVCRLTDMGYRVLGAVPPPKPSGPTRQTPASRERGR